MKEYDRGRTISREISQQRLDEHNQHFTQDLSIDKSTDTLKIDASVPFEIDPYISTEIKRAGELLHEARTTHHVTASEVAYGLHSKDKRTGDYIAAFEEGKIFEPNLTRITQEAEKYIDEEDERMKELKEIAERREEESKWLWLLEHDGISGGKAVKLIRLSQGKSRIDFERNLSLPEGTLKDLETKQISPHLSSFDQVIQKTEFEKKQKKVTQLIRLRSQHIEGMSVENFQHCSFGESVRYLRIQKGYSQTALGKASEGKSAQRISIIERDKYGSIPEPSLQALLKGLNVPEELRDFMSKKARGERLELSTRDQAILSENYYFLQPKKGNSKSPFTESDEKLSQEVRQAENFGEGFKIVRKEAGLTQYQLGKRQTSVSEVELGKRIPDDVYIADLVTVCGFNILDKTTQALLELAERDREVHHHRGNAKHFTKSIQKQ